MLLGQRAIHSASGDGIGQPASHYGAQAAIGRTGCAIGT